MGFWRAYSVVKGMSLMWIRTGGVFILIRKGKHACTNKDCLFSVKGFVYSIRKEQVDSLYRYRQGRSPGKGAG